MAIKDPGTSNKTARVVNGYIWLFDNKKNHWYKWKAVSALTKKERQQFGIPAGGKGNGGGGGKGGGGGGSSASGGGGGGGGGLTQADYYKIYKKTYWRIGIRASDAIMKRAYGKKIDNQGDFLLFVRRNDPHYITSEPGRQKAHSLLEVWYEFFPNAKLNTHSLLKFVQRNYTPDQMRHWLMRPSKKGGGMTKFQRLYPYFREANVGAYLGGSLGTQLATYREFNKKANQLWVRNVNRPATKQEMELMFKRHLTPEELEERMKTFGASNPSFSWSTGQGMNEQQRNEFLLNGPLSNQILSKLTRAYNMQKSYVKSSGMTIAEKGEIRNI